MPFCEMRMRFKKEQHKPMRVSFSDNGRSGAGRSWVVTPYSRDDGSSGPGRLVSFPPRVVLTAPENVSSLKTDYGVKE